MRQLIQMVVKLLFQTYDKLLCVQEVLPIFKVTYFIIWLTTLWTYSLVLAAKFEYNVFIDGLNMHILHKV